MSGSASSAGVALAADALIALRPLALAAGAPRTLAAHPGGFATRRKGPGLEIADIREYLPGDDARHLDRNATARTGRLHVRQFSEERDRVTLLVADFRPAMFWGVRRAFRSVAAAEMLALIGWHVVETGGRVAVLAITAAGVSVVPPRPRVRGMLAAIRGLTDAHSGALAALEAGAQLEEGPGLDRALIRAERLVPAGSELCIASGFDAPGEGLHDTFDQLSRRRTLSLYLVTAGTRALPRGTYPVRMEDGRRARLRVSGHAGSGTPSQTRIAGRPVQIIDAGDPVETIALVLSGEVER